MTDLATRLVELETLARAIASDMVGDGASRMLRDAELVEVLSAAGRVQRLVEAVLIEAVGEVEERHENPDGGEGRIAHRFGCHNVSELVQRATMLAPASVGRFAKVAKAVRQPVVADRRGARADPPRAARRDP